MNNTVSYTERKKYVKFDAVSFLLYLNEVASEVVVDEESGKKADGYSYTGEQIDGSTRIEVVASTVTDENRRGKFVSGLIGQRYSIDDQIAILANGSKTDECAEELRAFEAYRSECKEKVDELLSR